MPKQMARSIADTALWVAYYRAIESERGDALFRDPYARRLAGKRGEQIARNLGGGSSASWSLSVRTASIDDLVLRAGLRRQVDPHLLAHFYQDVLTVQSLKPCHLDADRICAGNQAGSVILPGLIGDQSATDASLGIQNSNRGTGDHGTRLIGYGSQNTAEISLREQHA